MLIEVADYYAIISDAIYGGFFYSCGHLVVSQGGEHSVCVRAAAGGNNLDGKTLGAAARSFEGGLSRH